VPEDGRWEGQAARVGSSSGTGRERSSTQPVERGHLDPHADEDVQLVRPRRSMGIWIGFLIGMVFAGGFGALYYFHLPPFSPPPKPPEPTAETPKVETPTTNPPTTETPKTPEAKTPEAKTPEAKTPEAKTPEAKTPEVKTPVAPKDKNADKVDKLVRRARLLLVEGHAHGALDELRKAEKLHPKDASLKVLEQQAQGKLGHGLLMLEGKGAVTVDGHKFPVPKKLKLQAGPHLIDDGGGEYELTLKRGGKQVIKVKK
jgi:hypothetical protein